MFDIEILDVYLHHKKIGTITHLPGDRNLFTFTEEYTLDDNRTTLSLSFKDTYGDLITNIKSTRTALPPFFSNLLPEGPMRDYLASRANVNPKREFDLLAVLGKDLPGALHIIPSSSMSDGVLHLDSADDDDRHHQIEDTILRFSLAGIQFKFSADWDGKERLTIPVDGAGGSWIAKLPSTIYSKVPENEYAMMELARHIGIDVPETGLVPIEQIHGIPKGIRNIESYAYIIKRFDRESNGQEIHIEDFAQVFGVFPEKKYQAASYKNIAEVIFLETGEEGIIEFIRRFVFNALIGNGDMHLKNWSLIYRDQRKPTLAPAYDFVSTLPYIPDDNLALNFVDSKSFFSLSEDQLKRFASKARLPEALVLSISKETVVAFKNVWNSIHEFLLDDYIIKIIDNHLKNIPLYQGNL